MLDGRPFQVAVAYYNKILFPPIEYVYAKKITRDPYLIVYTKGNSNES